MERCILCLNCTYIKQDERTGLFCKYKTFYILYINDHAKMVRCTVTLDPCFPQCCNREYRTVNKIMLLIFACIVPLCTNVNK